MITKGTEEYKKAQELATKLFDYSKTKHASYSYTSYKIFCEMIGEFCNKIMRLGGFAAQVAKTVDDSILADNKYQVANISSKQAWILACTAIENGIEFGKKY